MSTLKSGIQLTKRGILLNASIFAIFFTFYFVFSLHLLPKVIGSSNNSLSTIQTIFSLTIAGTMLSLSFLQNKLMQKRVILLSSAMVTLLTFLLLFTANPIFIAIAVFFVGIFFGIGQLSFFTHFWNTTVSEERGRIGGIIGFTILPFYFIVNSIAASSLDSSTIVLLASTLSLIPMLALLLRPKKSIALVKRNVALPEKRTILLYAIPWILFSVIDATLAKNIALNASQVLSPSSFEIIAVLQTVAALMGTLIGGIVADFFGRRTALAFSVTIYGMGMAFSGLIQNVAIAYFAFMAEGLSWGILLTLYSFVIWGDLSNKENCTKMYAIGLMTFYVAAGVGQLPTGIAQIPVVASALIGCALIFFSNVPIALAPELQSSGFLEKIRMKMHMKAVKKAAKEFENQG